VSRLDSFIRRLQAQRAVLDWAATVVRNLPGVALELGLGNGRTFSHLREKLPGREIFAFDRADNAHPDSKPPASHLILGEFSETLPAFAKRHPRAACLVHCDTGSGDVAATARQAEWLSGIAPLLACPGGLVLSDQPLLHPALVSCPAVKDVPQGRYFVYTASPG